MNVKIKTAGVNCPFWEKYEEFYLILKKQLVSEDEQLFTARSTGTGYLQWDLPGDGWCSLAETDPLLEQEVVAEYNRRRQLVIDRFGDNIDMALQVLTVPDDSFVYYKIDESNKIYIKLTAWGYSYPTRIDTAGITGLVDPKLGKEYVQIRIVYDDKPMPDKEFVLNRILPKKTGPDGVYPVGNLPFGYQFDVDVDGQHRHITVIEGCGDICIDLTVHVDIEVGVQRDGVPYDGAKVAVSYMGRLVEPVCSNGVATVRMPLSLNNDMCVVTVDGQSLQRPLVGGVERFVFQLHSPAPVPDPAPVPAPDLAPDPVPVPVPVPVPDPVPIPDPTPKNKWYENSKWGCLFTGLLALLIGVLLYCTFFICLGLLNG